MQARETLLAVLTLAIASAACQPPAQDAVLSGDDVAAIGVLQESLNEAALAGDWAAAAEFLAEDLVYMPPGMQALEGRSAWLEWAGSLGVTIAEMTVEVIEIDGRVDLAYLRGSYSQTFTIEGVPEPISDTGKYLFILKKQTDGSWRVAIWIWNPNESFLEGGPEA
jgi:ketosteroid isomerase-like protein